MLLLKATEKISDEEIKTKETELTEKIGDKVIIIPKGFEIVESNFVGFING